MPLLLTVRAPPPRVCVCACDILQAGLPVDELRRAADLLLDALPAAAAGALDVAERDLAGLRREGRAAQRARASRVQITMRQAVAVHADTRAQLAHLRRPCPDELLAAEERLNAHAAELEGLVQPGRQELDETV